MGSGKSRVADEFRRRGAPVISGDALGHEALRQPEIRNRLIERWGERVLNERGEVDRSKVAAIVFADPSARQRLEAIVHPAVHARRQARLRAVTDHAFDGLVVLDTPLLVEVGGAAEVDRLLVVYADRSDQLARLRARDGLDEAEAERRLASQMPLADKVRLAHYVIDNSGSPEETAAQVRAVHAALLAEHRGRGGGR